MQEESCRELFEMSGFSYSDELKSDMDEIIALVNSIENFNDEGFSSTQEICPLRADSEEKPLSFSLNTEEKFDFSVKRVVKP